MLAAFRDPHILPWICLLFGLMVGSFLNVVIYRLPLMLKRDWREQALEVLTEWAGEKDAPAALLPHQGSWPSPVPERRRDPGTPTPR